MITKEKNGITLISLVITIVIMLILAGVSVSFVIGKNGLFKKAESSSEIYKKESNKELLQHKITALELGKGGDAKLVDLNEWSDSTSENYEKDVTLMNVVSDTDTEVYVEFNGYKYSINSNFEINELDANTKPNFKIGDQTPLYEGWNASSVKSIYIGNNVSIPVPINFWYVGGNLDTGIIISDNQNDSYKSNNRDMSSYEDSLNMQGNQFVWIPVTRANYVKFNWNKSNSTAWSMTTNPKEYDQIDKYSGFYVARYEAGLPSTIPEIKSATSYNSDIYNKVGKPESKSNKIPWSFIDWNTCKSNTQSMYNYDYVKADLISGTEWDIILKTLQEKAGIDPDDGSGWGNTVDDNLNFSGNASIYYNGYQYPFGNTTVTGSKLYKTGMCREAMKYGIADFAGNIWERVDEAPSDTDTTSANKLLRGGGYIDSSTNYCPSFRDVISSATTCYVSIGFRAVLYIK